MAFKKNIFLVTIFIAIDFIKLINQVKSNALRITTTLTLASNSIQRQHPDPVWGLGQDYMRNDDLNISPCVNNENPTIVLSESIKA